MLQLYNMLMVCYSLLVRLAVLWNHKAQLIQAGRKSSLSSLISWRKEQTDSVIWVHCSSLGEYEQVVPLLQMIRSCQEHSAVALTFYSPSGYIPTKDKAIADWVGYLPADTHQSMSAFVEAMNPQIAIWVKNEWWWNCLTLLQAKDIPVHIVSATVRSDQYWVRSRIQFIDRVLSNLQSIGVVDTLSASLLPPCVPDSAVYVSGDMRADRVLDISNQKPLPHFSFTKLAAIDAVIVYGSMWLHDRPAFTKLSTLYPNHVHVIFPHDLSEENIAKMQAEWMAEVLDSDMLLEPGGRYIVPQIGLLSTVYRYAQLAYVGGGYGQGVHNVLEAAVYHQLTLVGPKHHKSSECMELLASGAIMDTTTIAETIDYQPQQISNSVNQFFEKHRGAVDRTYRVIFEQ